MFEQVMENFLKASEATLQTQQEMFQQWTKQWGQVPGGMVPGAPFGTAWFDQGEALRRRWATGLTDILTRHRETMDSQYRAGIRTIEDAFRVGEAKDPEHFRKLVEELWRQSFNCLKTVTEAQMRELQGALEAWMEAASKGMAAVNPTTKT
jgi:hypothetical protein